MACLFFYPLLVDDSNITSRLRTAAQDVGTRAYNALLFTNQSSTISLSAQANFNYCPMSLGLNASCAVNPPQFSIYSAAIVYPNTTIRFYDSTSPIDPVWNPWVLDNDTQLAVYNLIQTVYACIRIDLGNPSSNNFILNPAALNGTISPTFPLTQANGEAFVNSSLYTAWAAPFPWLQQHLPVTVSGPATIQVVYPCQFQQLKSLGSLAISVLVATLSMFSTGWGIFMLVATAVAKRNNPTGPFMFIIFLMIMPILIRLLYIANRCDGHCFRHRVEPSWFDVSETYGLRAREFFGPKRQVPDAELETVYQPVPQSPSLSLWKDLPSPPDAGIDSSSKRTLLNDDVPSDS